MTRARGAGEDRRVFTLAGGLAVAGGVQLVLGVFRSAALARWLGEVELGRLAYALAILSFADALALVAGPQLLTRELAAKPKQAGRLFGPALVLRGGATFAAGLVAWPLAGPWALPWLLARTGELGLAWLRAARLARWQIVAGLLPPVLTLGAVLAAAGRAPASGSIALAAIGLASLAAAAGQLACAAVTLPVAPAWSGSSARLLGRESGAFWLAALCVGLLYRMDVLLLRALLSEHDGAVAIGFYQPAYALVESGHLLLGALVTASFPVFAALHATDRVALGASYRKARRIGLLLGGLAAAGTFVVAEPVVLLLYGGRFGPSVLALRWLAPALVLVVHNSLTSSLLTAVRRQSTVVAITVAQIAVNGLANLWAIPRYGFAGAAAVTTLTELAGTLLLWGAARRVTALR